MLKTGGEREREREGERVGREGGREKERWELTNLSSSFFEHTTSWHFEHTTSWHFVHHEGPDSVYQKAEGSRHVTA